MRVSLDSQGTEVSTTILTIGMLSCETMLRYMAARVDNGERSTLANGHVLLLPLYVFICI